MKVYLVYSYIPLEMGEDVFMPSGIVEYIASSLSDAICYMEDARADIFSWWRVELFEVGKNYQDEEENGVHIGWYSNEVEKLEYSPFNEIVFKMRDNKP